MNSFKPGDWVRYKGITQISHITHTGYHLSNGYITKGDNGEMKLWHPKAGEWCWFYKEQVNLEYAGTHWAIPYLGRFGKFTEQGVQTIENFCYSFCEPFIGQLPTFIKDQS